MSRSVTRDMRVAPRLDPDRRTAPPRPRHALLINPFYPKDFDASFGKHALTPTLALTSIAAATPPEWTVRYWDENLLQGPPPVEPFPQVVGITVHLTFADRAYELAAWYRARGVVVLLGGLHAVSCPDEVAQHADGMALAAQSRQRRYGVTPEVRLGPLRQRRRAGARSRLVAPAP